MNETDQKAPEIPRPNVIRTLATLLSGETQAVVLEGPDGSGKSTLLRQFAESHPSRCFLEVVSTASVWASDPDHVETSFANQMLQVLRGRDLTDDELRDSHKIYGRLLGQLDRLAKREQKPFFLILDGLDIEGTLRTGSVEQLLDLLPFGYEGFRFLLAGDVGLLPLTDAAKSRTKPWRVTYFTRDETAQYLKRFALDQDSLDDIYLATAGSPGYLSSVWRRLHSGTTVVELRQSLPLQTPNSVTPAVDQSFSIEWRSQDGLSAKAKLAMAILAFEPGVFSIDHLATLTGATSAALHAELRQTTFLDIRPERVVFASDQFRQFAAGRLRDLEDDVDTCLMHALMQEPDSAESLARLPSILARSSKPQELLDYLSPERFARLLHASPYFRLVQEKADEGIRAAQSLGRHGDLLRFVLQKSVIRQLATSDVAVAEVTAQAALGSFQEAISIATGVRRAEHRFRLLAAIGRVRKEQGLPEDPVLTEQLKSLFDDLDVEALGESVTDTASDLFASVPQLATKLINRLTGATGENAIDWALAQLSIHALLHGDETDGREQAIAIAEGINYPPARKFSIEAAVMLGHLNAQEVLRESSQMSSTGDKILLLRRWMAANRDAPDAVDVLNAGIKMALQATEYSANAQVFRELALCLPYVQHAHAVKYFADIIDAQRSELMRIGPGEQVLRLQLLLARAEWRHDRVVARGRLIDAYNMISEMTDLVDRVSAVARLTAALARMDPSRALDADDGLHTLAHEELLDGVNALLVAAADHYDAFRRVVAALSIACPTEALAVIEKLNTESRRDACYLTFVDAATAAPLDEWPTEHILASVDKICHPAVRDTAIEGISSALRRHPLHEAASDPVEALVRLITTMRAPSSRMLSSAALVVALTDDMVEDVGAGSRQEELCAELMSEMARAWEEIDADWAKLQLGYEVVSILASSRPTEARALERRVASLRAQSVIADEDAANAASLAIRLAIRAYSGYSAKVSDSTAYLGKLQQAIGQLGSVATQVRLLAELSIYSYLSERRAECERLVQERIVPQIEAASKQPALRSLLIEQSSPALYLGARATWTNLLGELSPPVRDEALFRTARTILRRTSPWEAFEAGVGAGYNIHLEDVNRLIEIIQYMEHDTLIYSLINDIVNSATKEPHSHNFKQMQRADIARRLREVCQDKFPASRFIQHAGYRIAAEARLNQLLDRSDARPMADLAREARAIPNLSDRAFVLAIVGANARTRAERAELFAEAEKATDELAVNADRIDRYETIARLMFEFEPTKARRLLQTALRLAFAADDDSVIGRRQQLLRQAMRLDPDIAGSIASITDDEQARLKIEREARLHQLKNSLVPRRGAEVTSIVASALDWSRASWMRLGELIAGRIDPVNPSRVADRLQLAGEQVLSRAYPITAYFVENSIRFVKGVEQTRRTVGPLLDACLLGADVALRASPRPIASGLLIGSDVGHEANTVIVCDDRKQGIAYIEDWLMEVRPPQVWIVDPYFGPEDVAALALIQRASENCQVTVLSGYPKGRDRSTLEGGLQDLYLGSWRRHRDDSPPSTVIIFARCSESEKCPIHDRWWLSEESGLQLGTSFGGLGKREATIRRLDADEVKVVLNSVMPYVSLSRREFDGERIEYLTCQL